MTSLGKRGQTGRDGMAYADGLGDLQAWSVVKGVKEGCGCSRARLQATWSRSVVGFLRRFCHHTQSVVRRMRPGSAQPRTEGLAC
jgi:hypothetical protein